MGNKRCPLLTWDTKSKQLQTGGYVRPARGKNLRKIIKLTGIELCRVRPEQQKQSKNLRNMNDEDVVWRR